ncbi:MAG: DUF465 domain-containing protein [Alphaproteobacteria bacterium]|nr:DUF465 domain-containing protein [Alphaproteobacteria bacterium]
MITEAHDFASEFPEFKQAIHTLKTTNGHFAKLFEQYNQVNKDILRIETGIETASDEHTETLKKLRLKLKDDLFQSLKQAA